MVTPKVVGWLWIQLAQAFGHRFVSQFGEKDDGTWYEGLKDLSAETVRRGFYHLLKSFSAEEKRSGQIWPPNLKEFRWWCEDQENQNSTEQQRKRAMLPNVHQAFLEMEKNQYRITPLWSHPLVCLAASRVPNPDESYRDRAFNAFQPIYEDLVHRFLHGETLSLPNCYLTNPLLTSKEIHGIEQPLKMVSV